ncbi:hypothetical protein HUN39_13180 [Methylocystis sp. FS]|uniref:hypothetical protein n=1 Tax=Methylocystis silviterrae TaxID=2743612 RepID=UPI001582D657|nr:hypothetical protein [Methylocystis silviterrae]NUJ80968.1 hypothetical protein [Methylocystis silviterrae]
MMEEKRTTRNWEDPPSTFSNFFTVAASPAIVRVSFGEAFGSPETAKYRLAVSMIPEDAEALAKSILDTIEKDKKARSSSAMNGKAGDA